MFSPPSAAASVPAPLCTTDRPSAENEMYPEPIVAHKRARGRALAAYAKTRE